MIKNPLISVIVPIYNAEKHLRQCLESILNQTLKKIEIICVDDGSTDGSLDILKEYQSKDDRIIILKQQHKYAGVARNVGLQTAKGKYLSFLDSDDWFELNMLENMYDKAEEDNSDIVVCGWYNFNNSTQQTTKKFIINSNILSISPFAGKKIPQRLFIFSKPNAWTKLFNREFFLKHNLQFEPCKCYNDMTCVYLACALAERISTVKECYVHYRNSQKTNLTSQWNQNFESLLYATSQLEKKLKELHLYNIFGCSFTRMAIKRINDRYVKIPNDKRIENVFKAKEILSPELFDKTLLVKDLKTTKIKIAQSKCFKD
jgi:glycosyltransferase involved in cell wall biosynthesis